LSDDLDLLIAGVNNEAEEDEIAGVRVAQLPGDEVPDGQNDMIAADDKPAEEPIEPADEPVEIPGVANQNIARPVVVSDGEDDSHDVEDDEASDQQDDEMAAHQVNQRYGEHQHDHSLRPRRRRPRDYSHLHAILEDTVMTQYAGANKGLKIFGETGAESILAEMQQLRDRTVIDPKLVHMLTKEEKQKSLYYLPYIP